MVDDAVMEWLASTTRAGLFAAACVIGVCGAARAQDPPNVHAQQYRLPVDSRVTLWTDDTDVAPDLYTQVRLSVNHLNGPLAVRRGDLGENEPVQADASTLDISGSFSYWRLRLGVDVPVYLLATGDLTVATGGLGKALVDLKGTILPPKGDDGFGLGASVRLGLPTAGGKAQPSFHGTTLEVAALADKRFGSTLVALNVGYLVVRKREIDGFVFPLDDVITFRVGAGTGLGGKGGLSADFSGQIDRNLVRADPMGAQVEMLLGGWLAFADAWVLRGGIGTGLTSGVGSTTIRPVLSLAWEPPRDRDADDDGYVNRKDGCPLDPEDYDDFEDGDGCPEPDNDQDTMLDIVDGCPNEAEDWDSWQDDDGCPDPLTHLTLRVVDVDGRTISHAKSALTGADSFDGGATFTVDVEPGTWTFAATADGFDPANAQIEVPAGAPVVEKLSLVAKVVFGAARVSVTTTDGRPLDATWSWNGEAPLPITGGSSEIVVLPGRYEVVVESPGYQEEIRSPTVVAKETVTLNVALKRATGFLVLTVTDSEGNPIDAFAYAIDDADPIDGLLGYAEEIVPVGTHVILVTAPGYKPAAVGGEVFRDEETPVEVALQPARVVITPDQIQILDKVFFEFNKAVIKEESFPILDEVATVLLDAPDIVKVRVEGHTDTQGSSRYNQTLSEARAAAVLEYLVAKGVERERLVSEGKGESTPLDPAETEEAHATNRRVEFHIVERSR